MGITYLRYLIGNPLEQPFGWS